MSWALLGDINLYSASNNAGLKSYEIVERVVHPNYNPTYVYNDIGLFRLGTDVVFSAFVRPICLNTNQSLYFKTASATGWGRIRSSEFIYFHFYYLIMSSLSYFCIIFMIFTYNLYIIHSEISSFTNIETTNNLWIFIKTKS